MLDEKDLQAIAQLMALQKKELISEVNVLMESYFDPKFNALSERLDAIEQKMVPMEAVDILDDRMDDAEKAIELHTQEIAQLKKAQ